MTVKSYFDQVDRILNHLRTTQQAAIEQAAEWITESHLEARMLHIFGAAHSSLIAADAPPRRTIPL